MKPGPPGCDEQSSHGGHLLQTPLDGPKDFVVGGDFVHAIDRYNPVSNKLEPFYNDPNSPERKFSNVMHSAYSDRQGNLWLCPYSHGIEKVVFRKSPFTFYKPVPEQLSSAKNEVRSLFQDKDNWLWVGTKNGFMYLYDTNRKLMGRLGADGRINSANLLKASVYGITSDHTGAIWLASKGMGLFSHFDAALAIGFILCVRRVDTSHRKFFSDGVR